MSNLEEDPVVGTVLDNTYRVTRVLAEGGMGRIYVASHVRIASKQFAIKMMLRDLCLDSHETERFQREVEAVAAIHSPHVLDVYDFGTTSDNLPYFVSELLDGRDLAEYLLEHNKLSVEFSVRIIRQICSGLAAAHNAGVVHRDIKPDNIFLTGDQQRPHAKIVDFGIARMDNHPTRNLTLTGVVMGTPAFMSPEQAKGERVDFRADIYGLGTVLYRMLTGTEPFYRNNEAAATMVALLTEDPPRPSKIEPSIPLHLEAVIQRSMAKQPELRYESMAEFSNALAPFAPEYSISTLDIHDASSIAPSDNPSLSRRRTDEIASRSARPSLTGFVFVSTIVLLCSMVLAGSALIRLLQESNLPSGITGTEITLLLFSSLGLMLAPAIPAWRYISRHIWPNTARAVDFVNQLRPVVAYGLCTYGLMALLIRFIETLILPNVAHLAWPGWDLLLFGGICIAVLNAIALQRRFFSRILENIANFSTPFSHFLRLVFSVPGAILAIGAALSLTVVIRPPLSPNSPALVIPSADVEDPKVEANIMELTGSRELAPKKQVKEAAKHGLSQLLELETQFPNDPQVLEPLAIAQAKEAGNYGKALEAVEKLAAIADPKPLNLDASLAKVIKQAASGPETVFDKAIDLLAHHVEGPDGPDLLFELALAHPEQSAKIDTLLAKSRVRENMSVPLRIAQDFRLATTCEARETLIESCKKNGDERVAELLRPLTKRSTRGCGFLGLGKCPYKCPKQLGLFKAALKSIEKRNSRSKKPEK